VNSFFNALACRARSMAGRAFVVVNGGLAAGFAVSIFGNLAKSNSSLISDFTVFWTGWTLVLQNRAATLYDEAAQRATQQSLLHGMHFEGGLMAYLNPPHAALATTPVGWLADHTSEQTAFIVWSIGLLALLAVFVRTLCEEWGGADRRQRWMLALAVLAFHPVFCALKQGQTSILLALAVLGVYRAANSDRRWAGAAWLVVLTIKPQLVPLLAVYLAARRSWDLLWRAAVLGSIAVVVTAIVLGPAVWIQYLGHVRQLEHFWGTGTPEYMLNVRGLLTRVFGFDQRVWVDRVGDVVWLATMLATGALLVRRRIHEETDHRPAYAFVVAVMLLSNPHVFVHDVVVWVVPLVLCAAALRDRGDEWRGFAWFALSWPIAFAAGGFFDVKSPPLTIVDPRIWAFAAATMTIASCWRSRLTPDVREIRVAARVAPRASAAPTS
jgi:glycosyl transferase family 87